MAGLSLEDLRHMSWKTFEAILELDEWAKAPEDKSKAAEDAFWGM